MPWIIALLAVIVIAVVVWVWWFWGFGSGSGGGRDSSQMRNAYPDVIRSGSPR
jgi:hypothetical protein